MKPDRERRASSRVQVALAVRYESGDAGAREGRVENISRGGVLLVVGADAVPLDAKVRITFTDEAGVDRAVIGKVVRRSPEGMLGVTFLEVDDATFAYVESILTDG